MDLLSKHDKDKSFCDSIISSSYLQNTTNKNETIKFVSHYNLNDEQDVKYIKDKTPHELIKRGLIEKVFGGVGNTAPSTAQ